MRHTHKCPRVLHIMSGYGGGISAFIANKAQAFADQDVPFDVITFDDTSSDFERLIEETGGKVYKITNPKEKGSKFFYNEVNSIMNKLPEDTLIHSHVYGIKAIPFYLIAKKNKLHRFVIHAHTAAPQLKNNFLQEKLKKWVNRSLSKEKLSCGIKASINIFGEKEALKNDIVHIPNSINYEEFSYKRDSKQLKKDILGIDDNRLVIGSIARFRELKNHKFMVEIIKDLKESNIDFVWFFAGEGLLKNEIEQRVKDLKLEKNVIFLGYRDDIPNLFEMMDIFVLPSLNEGLPTVVIEAQAASTTSLLSDTITKECDLGLGLVNYLSIQDKKQWVESIKSFRPVNIESSTIEKRLIEGKFTNDTSASLYNKFLNKEVKRYMIKSLEKE
ncbi:glycosyltransferase family 1 protein [Alkalibacterium sp. m-11]|uniref:Glycosyltransferase family 1 protein n=1 Tax=Alkalibacterium indicireducens TaxID=398758 RepID=A0ABN1AV67_9LACT